MVLTAEAIDYYWDHCYDFVLDNFVGPARKFMPGVQISSHQKQAMDEISKYQKVGIESGHGTGKSTTFSWIGQWFLCTRGNKASKVRLPCIAPTYHQLQDVLWPEVKFWLGMSRLKVLLDCDSERIWRKDLDHGKDIAYGVIRSVVKSDNLQGFHAPHLLWICDEAFGIERREIWETIEGSLTSGIDNKIIFGGQHSRIIGYCHEAITKDKWDAATNPGGWRALRFNSEESEIADKAYGARIAARFGKYSDVYRVRVLGTSPKGNPDAFISLEECDAAKNREVEPRGIIRMGVDAARFGDDLTVITSMWGDYVFPQQIFPQTDSFDIANEVIDRVRKLRHISGYAGLIKIKIDITGGYGSGAYDILVRNTTDNIQVIGVHFGGGRGQYENYYDKITAMWGEAKRALQTVQLGMVDIDGKRSDQADYLIEELSTRRKTYANYKGKLLIKLESKDDYKTDYEISPDRADSFVLAVSEETATRMRVFGRYASNDPAMHKPIEIKWDQIDPDNVLIYVGLWLEKDFGLYGNVYLWGRTSRRLFIYGELIHPNPVASLIARSITDVSGARLDDKGLHVDKILGNPDMFKGGKDLKNGLRRKGVRVRQNPQFELAGGILLANGMFQNKEIVLDMSLQETDRQYREWESENKRPVIGYPLCRCLAMVVSDLKERGEFKSERPLPGYSRYKMGIREKLRSGNFRKERTGYEWLTR